MKFGHIYMKGNKHKYNILQLINKLFTKYNLKSCEDVATHTLKHTESIVPMQTQHTTHNHVTLLVI